MIMSDEKKCLKCDQINCEWRDIKDKWCCDCIDEWEDSYKDSIFGLLIP